MKGILWEQRRSGVVSAVLTIALGLLLIFWPDRSVDFLCALLGAALLITGLVYILSWFARRRMGFPVWFLIPGIILAALGLWLMKSPEAVVTLVQYVFAAVLLFHGVLDLQSTIALATHHWQGWWLDLMLSLLTLGLGVLIFCNPGGSFAVLVMMIGISLAFDGVSDICIICRLGRAMKKAEQDEVEIIEEQDS